MDPLVSEVQHLDALANENPNLVMEQIYKIIESPNSLSYVPVIHKIATNQYIIMLGLQILDTHIKSNWASFTPDEKYEYREFLSSLIGKEYGQDILNFAKKILAMIAIRTYPHEWDSYLDDIMITWVDFQQVFEFLIQLETNNASILENERAEVIKQNINERKLPFLNSLLSSLNDISAINCFKKFISYVSWEELKQCDLNSLLQINSQDYFSGLCVVFSIEGLPDDFVQALFKTLASIEVENLNVFSEITDVLQKHIEKLETIEILPIINYVHEKLLNLNLVEILDYWESFVLSIYDQFKKLGGVSDRFTKHFGTLSIIRDRVIKYMIQPPDFTIPNTCYDSLSSDQNQQNLFYQFRSILICFIGMTPVEVEKCVSNLFNEIREKYNEERFVSIIWTLGCISGSTKSILETIFVIDSMKFILECFKLPSIDKSIIACSFLYLAAIYSKSQKLTPQFLEVSINLAIQALTSEKTQKIASNTLLAITKYSGSMIKRIPQGILEIVTNVVLPPEIYCDLCESVGRIFQENKKFQVLLDSYVARWNRTCEQEQSFDVAREQCILMYGFYGLSKVNPLSIEAIVNNLREQFTNITHLYGETIVSLYNESGENVLSRDDAKIAYTFLKAEILLFKQLVYKDCGDILSLYSIFPPDIRIPESLLLTKALFKSEIPLNIAQGLHETVIIPTEIMISEDPNKYWGMCEYLPQAMIPMINSYFDVVVPDDLTFLIQIIQQTNRTCTLNAIKAIDLFVEKADFKFLEDNRNNFFRSFIGEILFNLLYVLTDPSHSFCVTELLILIRKLFIFISSGQIRCKLFPDCENVEGIIKYLSQRIIQMFPTISISEILTLLQLIFSTIEDEKKFELYMATFISRARQTTEVESLQYLKIQKLKQNTIDFL